MKASLGLTLLLMPTPRRPHLLAHSSQVLHQLLLAREARLLRTLQQAMQSCGHEDFFDE